MAREIEENRVALLDVLIGAEVLNEVIAYCMPSGLFVEQNASMTVVTKETT